MDVISVIIPVYNAEEYLDRALNSVCGQTYEKLEILLIDDGSTDQSGKLCDAWAKKDKRIKVIHQENAGVSAARNAGLDHAEGKYIMFVDADDWIRTDAIEILYNLANEYCADVSCCQYQTVKSKEEHEYLCGVKTAGLCSDSSKVTYEKGKTDAGIRLLLPWAVYCKLYRMEIIQKIRFQKYRIAEDLLFNTDIICETSFERIVSTEQKLYYYYTNPNSAIHQKYQRKYLEGVQVEERCYDRLIEISPKFGDINIVGCSISMFFEKIAELSPEERKAAKEDFRWCKKNARKYKKALLGTTNRHRKISGALKVYVPDLYLWTLIWRKEKSANAKYNE